MIKICQRIENSSLFQNSIIFVIIFAGILVGIETYPEIKSAYYQQIIWLDRLVLSIFTVEILIKLVARTPRFQDFFKDPWNVFDFLIVAICYIPYATQYAMILRLLRLMRVLRLIRAVPRLQIVVEALLSSLPSMFYVSMLLMMLFYMYAVLGTFIFSLNDPVHFGNLQTSFLSLFRIVTLEDWTDLMYTQIYGCDIYGYGMREYLCQNPQRFPIIGPIYFVSFVLFGTMVFLNLFIGVIVSGMDEARKDQDRDIHQKILSRSPKDSLEEQLKDLEKLISSAQTGIEKIKKTLSK